MRQSRISETEPEVEGWDQAEAALAAAQQMPGGPEQIAALWKKPDNSDLEPTSAGAVAELVGIEGGVVSGVFNLESSGVEASDWRPRHDEQYYEA